MRKNYNKARGCEVISVLFFIHGMNYKCYYDDNGMSERKVFYSVVVEQIKTRAKKEGKIIKVHYMI
jgi:hypothetical protein